MAYFSETDKARELIDPKYLEGVVVDLGCGSHKIKPDAIGVDGRQLEGVNIVLDNEWRVYEFSKLYSPFVSDLDIYDFANCLYSSHLVEHLRNPTAAMDDWANAIRSGGYFILYLPDKRFYSNENNPEHMFDWDMDSFLFYFRRCFCGEGKNYKGENYKPIYRILETQLDTRPDCYSFLIIAQKL